MSYADSLRQQALWVREAIDPSTPETQRITLDDIDVDELEDAADVIDHLQTELDGLRSQLGNAMVWERADLLNLDTTAYYVVKDNGGEWRDFDLHVMNGRMVAHKLHPDYVRGRPIWIAKINPPVSLPDETEK